MPTTESANAPYIIAGYTNDTQMRGYHSSYHSQSGNRVFNRPLVTPERPASRFFMGSEIELAFKSESKRREFCDNPSNWYCCENDGSLSGAAPMELITIPLHPDDATNPDFWRPLCKKLSAMGARSWTNNTTGHHVHVSRSLFCDPEASVTTQYRQVRTAVGKMSTLYALFIEDNPKAHSVFGRTKCYSQVKLKDPTIARIAEIIPNVLTKEPKMYELLTSTVRSANRNRTCEVNLLNRHTVEFRMGKGSICAERIAAINEFVLLFSKWAVGVRVDDSCSLEAFEKYMRENVRPNSWLCHYYFNEASPDGKKTEAPKPRGNNVCTDDTDM